MAKVIKLNKTNSKKHQYKYGINTQVDLLPRNTTIEDLLLHLKQEGITRNEFYFDRNIAYGSESSIPSDRLFIYAQVFDCSVEDLINQPTKAKSIREVQSKVKIKTRLG